MRNESSGAGNRRRQKFGELLESDPYVSSSAAKMDVSNQRRHTSEYSRSSISGASPAYHNSSPSPARGDCSPYLESPWNQASPFTKSPWIVTSPFDYSGESLPCNGLIGSLVREEGHVYSLAISGDLLYTGSDSKNIRVWKNLKEFAGFKSNSGLVKAIVVCGERIFTGHQDGKIRVWRLSPTPKNWTNHKRIGSLPSFKDFFKKSMNPKNYIEVRRHRNVLQIQHFDAISCIGLNKEQGLLYTGSWDKSVKVWRVANSKFLESIAAHDDAVNSVVSGFDSLVFTGSADGTVKVWRRELHGRTTKHFLVQLLLKQDSAVTALAINRSSAVLYCGSSDGLVNFWEGAKHLSHGGTLRGHKLAVLCLSTAGRLVISGSADKNICVWKREEGSGSHTCLSILTGHTGPVKCLAVDDEDEDEDDPWESSRVKRTKKGDDGEWVVYSGSLDRSVKVWRVSEQSPELGRASFPVSPAMMG